MTDIVSDQDSPGTVEQPQGGDYSPPDQKPSSRRRAPDPDAGSSGASAAPTEAPAADASDERGPPEAGTESPSAGSEGSGGSSSDTGSEGANSSDARSSGDEGESKSKRRSGDRSRRRRRGRRDSRSRKDNAVEEPDDYDYEAPGEGEFISTEPLGILEVLGSGSGFIRRPESGYTPSKDDIYVGARLIQKFGLRTGDELTGEVGRRPKNGKSPPLTRLHLVNGESPENAKGRPDFNRLSAVHPDEQLVLECGLVRLGKRDYTNRVIDLFCPLGKGQRAMIVAPAKAGKTMVLQAIAEGVVKNHPECQTVILLLDERPEEVTEMEMCGFGEVVSSSFDQPAERHVAVAEMVFERARRQVEMGKDVVIILDSITRMARAYNTVEDGSGRTLSGGLGANVLEKPKRLLGSARKIDPRQGGGSLTVVATALVDTGSRMDQVIFEEFKGTGNSELLLSRELADRRIFPAIDLNGSATRREERLLDEGMLALSRAFRRQYAGSHPAEAMSELISVMARTETNRDLLALARSVNS